MSKRLESVEITFENLDYVLVPVEYFMEVLINSISPGKTIKMNAITNY